MKKISYLMSMACIALFASCSSDTDELVAENQSNGGGITIRVGMPDNDATRMEFKDNNIKDLVWSMYDNINIFNETEGVATTLELNEGFAGKSVGEFTLSPWGANNVKDDVTYTLVKGYVDEETKKIEYEYLNQEQDAFNNLLNLTNKLVLVSDPITGAELKAGTGRTLKHKSSILKLNIKSLPESFKNMESVNIKYFKNYGDATEENAATIKVKSDITAGADNFVYIAFDPTVALGAGKKIAFELVSGFASATVSAVSEGVTYKAGKIYSATLDFASGDSFTWDVAPAPTYVKVFEDLTGWALQGTKDSWTLDGSMWVFGVQMYAACGSPLDDTDAYLVKTEPITLKSNENYVQFHHAIMSGNHELIPQCCQFVVRAADVNGNNWTPIEGIWFNDETNGTQANQFYDSGKLTIPAAYNGKTIEVAFKMNQLTSNIFWWFIRDIAISGK